MTAPPKFSVLGESNYRRFIAGYGISYTLYWVTLLAIGWWMWEVTGSATWVGFVFFCDLFPSVLVTPWASALADRGDRFRLLKIILWIQVGTGFALSAAAYFGLLTPALLAAFVFLEGALIGFSQPAFFGLINRIVSPANLPSAVGLNVSVTQLSYVLGPLLAGLLFTFGIEIAPLAFMANAAGTLIYLYALNRIDLHDEQEREPQKRTALLADVFDGMRIFWTNQTVFRSMVLILGVAALQRPLLSLMPGINDHFDLFTPSFFTVMTASFMAGSVMAGLLHASRNSDVGLERSTPKGLAALLLIYCGFFLLQGQMADGRLLAIVILILIGLGCGYVWIGNVTILQKRTAEHLRSRVLGNNFMMTRAFGALVVISTGFIVEATGFQTGFIVLATIVALAVPLSLLIGKTHDL